MAAVPQTTLAQDEAANEQMVNPDTWLYEAASAAQERTMSHAPATSSFASTRFTEQAALMMPLQPREPVDYKPDQEIKAGRVEPPLTMLSPHKSRISEFSEELPNSARISSAHPSRQMILEGCVEKEGAWISTYRQRYMKITQAGTLAYYLTELDALSGDEPRGCTSLVLATTWVKAADGHSHPFVVRLQGGKTMTFRSSSEQETAQWVQAITQASANANLSRRGQC